MDRSRLNAFIVLFMLIVLGSPAHTLASPADPASGGPTYVTTGPDGRTTTSPAPAVAASLTACTLPAPALAYPVNNVLIGTLVPKYRWNNTGTTRYQIQVSAAADFSTYALNTSWSGLDDDPVEVLDNDNLAANTTYYWRVASLCQDWTMGAFSAVATFRTGNVTPPFSPAPEILAPPDGAQFPVGQVDFSWRDVPGAVAVQWRRYNALQDAQNNVNGWGWWSHSWWNSDTENFDKPGTIYWRLQTRDDRAWGPLSPVRTLIITGGGFQPNPNGYSFANYGGIYPAGDYDYRYDDLVRMFGASAVCWTIGPVCIVKPAADLWHFTANESMNGGHCDGMASTSLRFWKGLDQPGSFQAGVANVYDLSKSSARRHIAYYFVEQLTDPVKAYKNTVRQRRPSEVLNQIKYALDNNTSDPNTLFVRRAGVGGHVVTPFGVENKGNNVYWIKVYDNNYPNDAGRHVIVNTSAETWSYDLGGSLGVWTGDTQTDSFGAVPISLYATAPVCPWCSSKSTATASAALENLVWLTGRGHVLIQDPEGRRLGYLGEQFVDEIPSAYAEGIDGGMGIESEPLYTLPAGGQYSISVRGKAGQVTTGAGIARFGPGYGAAVQEITLDPGQDDLVTIAPDGREIQYRPPTDKRARFTFALDDLQPGEAEGYKLSVGSYGVTGGQTGRATVDAANGSLVLVHGEGAYELSIERTGPATLKRFVHKAIPADPADTHFVEYAQWKGDGPLTLEIDRGSDGTVDVVLPLENELSRVFLPLVVR